MSAVIDQKTEATTVICSLNSIVPDSGVAALIDGAQVAIFRIDNEVYAIGNRDPFSGANVMARGIVGSIGEIIVVSSPVYKQHFDLLTGQCLEDESVSVPTYNVSVLNGNIVFLG